MKVWNAETRRAYSHRLMPEDVQAIYERQGGMCGICASPLPLSELVVDHDHQSDERRGLLCAGCNTALGALEKGPAWMAAAGAYLADPPMRHVVLKGYSVKLGKDGNRRRTPHGSFYRSDA